MARATRVSARVLLPSIAGDGAATHDVQPEREECTMSIHDTCMALSAIERSEGIIALDMDMKGRWHVHMEHSAFMVLFAAQCCTTSIHSEEWGRISINVDGVDVFSLFALEDAR